MAEDPIKVQRHADEKLSIRETHVTTDYFELDPEGPLAVQIPEGSGATSVDDDFPLIDALRAGKPEDQFRAGDEAPAEERLPIRPATEPAPERKKK